MVDTSSNYSITDVQFNITYKCRDSYGNIKLTYKVLFKNGWDVHRVVEIRSSDSAYNILARAFRETFKDDGLTVWQDKVEQAKRRGIR